MRSDSILTIAHDHLTQALLTAALYHGTLGGDPAEAAGLLTGD